MISTETQSNIELSYCTFTTNQVSQAPQPCKGQQFPCCVGGTCLTHNEFLPPLVPVCRADCGLGPGLG